MNVARLCARRHGAALGLALAAGLLPLAAGAAPQTATPSGATSATQPGAACRDGIATFVMGAREVSFSVEIADTPDERRTGLMNRRSLRPGTGMLFVFQEARPQSFWMKNTLIPLDLLYMDATGVVRHIHRKARPMDLTPLPGAAPGDTDPDRLMVLEIGGGEAARLDIAPGAILRHPRLPQDKATAPCR